MTTAFLANQRGATAVEFALLLPAFASLLVGMMYLSILGFTFVDLHNAVETAARCAAVQTTACTSAAKIQAAASAAFVGLGVTPTFTYTAASCGHQVTGVAAFSLNTGLKAISVPITSTACYP